MEAGQGMCKEPKLHQQPQLQTECPGPVAAACRADLPARGSTFQLFPELLPVSAEVAICDAGAGLNS